MGDNFSPFDVSPFGGKVPPIQSAFCVPMRSVDQA